MKLTFAGSGSAFTIGANNYHSNMILENDKNQKFLIDCGSDARLSLNDLGLSYKDIHSVYISHLHADHVGGLEWLAFTTRFDPNCNKPNLYISDRLVKDLWEKVLSGGLVSLQTQLATLSTYFKVHPVRENSFFTWHGLEFKIIQTMHVVSGFTIMPSFGLFFSVNGKKIFITTDTQFSMSQLRDFYQIADLIFHDCETLPNKSGVHAHYTELATLPLEVKQKMWLYHYNPGPLPDAKKDGFLGFVKKGQSFEL
jgi:ribonuclease BN (tRNA processing enzyme)